MEPLVYKKVFPSFVNDPMHLSLMPFLVEFLSLVSMFHSVSLSVLVGKLT